MKGTEGVKLNDATGNILLALYRRPAIYIVKHLVNTKITPNQITFVSFLFKFPSAYFFSLTEYKYILLGAITFYLSILLDNMDGSLSRLRNNSNTYGAWLDLGVDEFGLVMVLFGMSWGVYSRTQSVWVWIFGFLAISSVFGATIFYQMFLQYFPQAKKGIFLEQKKKNKILKQF